MVFLKKVYNWILWSSANENQVSLTLKAGVPYLIFALGLAKLLPNFNAAVANQDVDNLAQILVLCGQVITGSLAIYGLARKIVLSFVSAQ